LTSATPDRPDLTACDREPIHIPGSIQPHGLLLVVDADTLEVLQAAGMTETFGARDAWLGRSLGAVIGDEIAQRVAMTAHSGALGGYMGQIDIDGRPFDVLAHRSGEIMLVEAEPASTDNPPPSQVLGRLDEAIASFERAASLQNLCERAVREVRRITGFDRVMAYRFLDDEAGVVLAEDKADDMPGFLNHHFPGSDIPRQARALYVRNLVRAIVDSAYAPSPLTPERPGPPVDMSDCALRSVSPIHLQYLRNMGVGASASISIVVDDRLWGLIACHHREPRLMPYEVRAMCRTLAAGLAQQIKARQEAEHLRERVRLRSLEDEVQGVLSREPQLVPALGENLELVRRLLGADGAALLAGDDLRSAGRTPEPAVLRELGAWAAPQALAAPFATHRLASLYPPAAAHDALASGLAAIVVGAAETPIVLMWTRAERRQVIEWAGNPHKAAHTGPDGVLTPRGSFDAWSESVEGVSRPWSPAEMETAARLRVDLGELLRRQTMADLNRQLGALIAETERTLRQKEVLMREMNHRIQNSLQIVSGFLRLQARAARDPAFEEAVEEARRRLGAVSLVHRRLYRADQIETIDMARYIEELWEELAESLDPEWAKKTRLHLTPVEAPTDRAVAIGLIATELIINANKYAYGGAPGPLDITLETHDGELRLIVADRGGGKAKTSAGFGSRMISALVSQLSGVLDYGDNRPGLRAVLSAPLAGEAAAQA
jgi:light-regulated signal transduction histidine kinase (bacteriophytochrome)